MLFKKKKFSILITVILMLILSNICANKVYGQPNRIEQNKLKSIMMTDKKVNMDYRGYAEYGYYLKFDKEYIKNDKTFLYYTGSINDACNFGDIYLNYEINNNKIIQKVKVNYYFPEIKQQDYLTSIIPDKIVLKLPLKKGNSWTQEFIYNDRKYSAETQIIDVYAYKGSIRYETMTKVKNNDEYFERCVYEKGKGLILFENNNTSYTLNE